MKIKAVRKNQSYTKQDYLTLGKEYEVERKVSPHYYSITDDAGEEIYAALNNCAHGFDFEVVQEELEQKAPKFKVGDGVMCKITLSDYVGVIDTLVRVLAKDSSDSTHGFDFDVVQEEPEGLCPDPMPVVEPVDDLECDRIEDNLNWLDGLIRGSPEQPTDNVNNPSHYGNGQIECIDYLEDFMTTEEFIGYLRGNIGKYLHRWRYKNGLEDLRKAEWYLKKLIEVYNG